MSRIYVGHSVAKPRGVISWNDPDTHPRDMKQIPKDIFTNNILLVDKYNASDVIVVSKSGKTKQLNMHPDYHFWKNEMLSGEFWSMVGEDWVDGDPV